MKKVFSFLFIALLFGANFSCQEQEVSSKSTIPTDVISKLQAAGFDTSEGLSAYKDGFLVEYDIFLTKSQIDELSNPVSAGKDGEVEHYRTTNLVTGTPRTIKVYFDPGFGTALYNEFLTAIGRYNAENLNITFAAETNDANADIQIYSFYENSNTLGYSAGFPTASGDPATPIRLNTKYYNSSSLRADSKTVIAHEIGHAIGFRHTDYMARRYSCGSGGNEGSAGVGAIWIPGTPKRGDANSWMLACSNGTDRPFTSNDKIALTTVY